MHWRHTLLAAFVAQIIFSTQTSYLHPDEFYQSFQIVYWKDIPWEVQNPESINRSIVPLLVWYYPIKYITQILGLSPYHAYLLTRIQFALLTTSVVSYFTYRLTSSRQDAIKSLLITATSFITLVHQTHTFSNSIETIILLPSLYLIDAKCGYLTLGALIAFGTFNRITFAAWIFLPLLFQLRYFLQNPLKTFKLILSFTITASIFVLIDTIYYNSRSWTIAPLNNIMYNADTANLQLHGIHPRITHFFVNLPLILGPMIIPFITTIYKGGKTKTLSTPPTTTTLSIISSLIIHSVFPHQELRFLQPIAPLLGISINPVSLPHGPFKHVLRAYTVYNALAAVFFAVLHQGGVVAATEELNAVSGTSRRVVFWRTYRPPTFLVPDHEVVDLMGASRAVLQETVQSGDVLVASDNGMHDIGFTYERIWHTWRHLDMDHWEVAEYGWNTFIPGLSIYRVL